MEMDAWYRALPASVQVVILACLMPAVILHELTHYAAARATGADAWFNWDDVAVVVEWQDDVRTWSRSFVFIAPSIVGMVSLLGLMALVTRIEPQVGIWTLAYMTVNLFLYVYPSGGDIDAALDAAPIVYKS